MKNKRLGKSPAIALGFLLVTFFVNINSNRNALIQAYPNASGVLGGLSESFRLRDTPGIYYKH